MIRPPHRLFALLWREADAATGALHTLHRNERAVAGLTANPVASLADPAAIAWAFEALGGTAAIAQSLARLRGASTVPLARRIHPGPPPGQGQGFGPSADTLPADAISGLNGARGASFRARSEIGATEAEPCRSPSPARDAVSELTEATRRAARRPVGGGVVSAPAQRAIRLILHGLRPSAAALFAAVEMAGDEPPAPASPSVAAQIAHVLGAGLARIDTVRGAQVISVAAPMQSEHIPPGPSLLPTPPASGFRRLAALFAQPAADLATDPLAGMHRATPAFAADPPVGTAPHRQPAPILPQATPREAAAPRFSIPRHIGDDIAVEAEVAELLARVLRREARRQGIADDGGAA